MALAAVGAVGGFGPMLVRTSARASWSLTRAAGSAGSRAVRGAASAGLAGPAAVTRAATALLAPDPKRGVWSAGGRAQLEVWGLDGPECPAVVAGVQQALAGLDGVSWARVDAVTRRAAVRFDPARVATAQLAEAVAAAEHAAGVACPGYPHEGAGDGPLHDSPGRRGNRNQPDASDGKHEGSVDAARPARQGAARPDYLRRYRRDAL